MVENEGVPPDIYVEQTPADVMAGKPMRRARICRTFSDCTSGPRNGLVSGCFPLDPFYPSHVYKATFKWMLRHPLNPIPILRW